MGSNGDITILGENHTNNSGMWEATRLARAQPGTVIQMEMPAVFNGVFDAYYRGEISDDQIRTLMRGYVFTDNYERASQWADSIIEAKNNGVRVMAYDPRDMIEGRSEGRTGLESYLDRKEQQYHKERQEAEAATARWGGTGVMATMQPRLTDMEGSLALMRRYGSTDPLHERIVAAGLEQGYNSDLISAMIISSQQPRGGQSVVVAGENHISGQVQMLGVKNFGAFGVLDEALESLGYQPKVYAVRDSADAFLTTSRAEVATREVYDGFITINESGERRVFDNRASLERSLRSTSPENTDAIANGELYVSNMTGERDAQGNTLLDASQHPDFAEALRGLRGLNDSLIKAEPDQPVTPATVSAKDPAARGFGIA